MVLELKNVTKRYPGTYALSEVDFSLRAGEVHVLFGENGAGKSTLINVITGTTAPTDGEILIDGKPCSGMTPASARRMGVSAVFQEFSLVPNLSVVDNLFMGREIKRGPWLDRPKMRARARETFDQLGFDVDVDAAVGSLSRAKRQMTEIAKALLVDARIVILDEPTASLSDSEADHVLEAVRQLRTRGVGVIYVSHRVREIREIADRVTVLRGGRRIATVDIDDVSTDGLVEMMIGRRIENYFPEIDQQPGEVLLGVQGLSTEDGSVKDVSIEVRAGEIVGIAGLVGCGKGALGRALYGMNPVSLGSVIVRGEALNPKNPRQMLRKRLCYFPSDRATDGLAMNRTILENGSIAALDVMSKYGILKRARERVIVQNAIERLVVRPAKTEQLVSQLSGGNKQKVLLARGLVRDIDVFIFDEPTVGIDVGAKTEVYGFMKELVERGAAVLLISSEMPEIINLCRRSYVMHDGELVAHFEGKDMTEANILTGFFGKAEAARAMEQDNAG